MCSHAASKPSDLRVGKVGVGLNWAVGQLGICLRISHETTVGEMEVGEMGMNCFNKTCLLCTG